jgi:hypothetical protein
MAPVVSQYYAAPERPLLGQVRMTLTMMAVYAALMSVSALASGIPTFLAGLSERALLLLGHRSRPPIWTPLPLEV